MHRKMRIATGAAAVLTALMLMLPASAHGGHHRRNTVQVTSCGVCTVENCHTAGRHTHRGVTYCGYGHGNGVCDGTCAALCPVEGCTVTGRHTHNGTTYCGYQHSGGFCDGSCAVISAAQTNQTAQAAAVTGGCHGHHGRC